MNILILFADSGNPMRTTVEDLIYSFRRYSEHRCFYVNLVPRPLPSYLHQVPFDLVIFHTTFLSYRWSPELFATLREKAEPLKHSAAVKIALPQDEFIHTDILCDFINDFGVNHVFSVAPESEWEKIYASVDRQKVTFHRILTGYLDERTISRVKEIARSVTERPIDVGYRAWHAAPWLGRHGLLKVKIHNLFREKAPKAQLTVDISTEEKDTLLGDEWYKFLLRCKYTIGVEGGASILDRDGKIKKRTEDYLDVHPGASFEEIEAACFPGLDGYLNLMALSPRHLEACLTRTCQVLVEGQYNGILEPDKHYIELKRDLSNIDAVVETLKQDQLREGIAERAYRDIVESGRYTYRNFVDSVTKTTLGSVEPQGSFLAASILSRIVFHRMWLEDKYASLYSLWFYPKYVYPVRSKLRLRTRLRALLINILPNQVLFFLRRRRQTKDV